MPTSSASRRSLAEIALSHGTDKQMPGRHSYAAPYEQHLGALRDRPIRLLEIGIGGYENSAEGGESLRMWKEYFPAARIVGLDIHDKTRFAEERITILQGDQGDAALLARISAEHGPFDVVIDDGSHRWDHVIASFDALFPLLANDGIYVIEDLQTSYWDRYSGASFTPPMERLKRLVDGINHAEFDVPGYQPTYTDRWIRSMTFHHNLVFIMKGDNAEGSSALEPHPRPRRMFEEQPGARLRKGMRRLLTRITGRS